MFILPSTLTFYDEPPRQTGPSLPMSVVLSLLTHVAAILALLYFGLPTPEQLPLNIVLLTLVEPSRPVPAQVVQAKQLAQTATSVPQINARSPAAPQSEPVKPTPIANTPLAAPTAIASTTNTTAASSVAVQPTLPADSIQTIAVQSSAASPTIIAAQTAPKASAAPAAPAAPVSAVAVTATKSSVAAVSAVPALPAPITELPSSSAAYLNNPPPTYPAQSRRLGEQGIVKWRVLIGTDGKASEPELAQSSGFARLDEAAKQAVLTWRYVPGKRGGVAEAMRYVVPIHFN